MKKKQGQSEWNIATFENVNFLFQLSSGKNLNEIKSWFAFSNKRKCKYTYCQSRRRSAKKLKLKVKVNKSWNWDFQRWLYKTRQVACVISSWSIFSWKKRPNYHSILQPTLNIHYNKLVLEWNRVINEKINFLES